MVKYIWTFSKRFRILPWAFNIHIAISTALETVSLSNCLAIFVSRVEVIETTLLKKILTNVST